MKIALATDHTGFEQLKELQKFLGSLKHECWDFGPQEFVPNDDYPDFIKLAAEKVSKHNDANMIIISSRFVSLEDMKQVIKLWLETDFSNEEHHARRIEKIDQ
jgi:ribose 5-phosphate isomerase B